MAFVWTVNVVGFLVTAFTWSAIHFDRKAKQANEDSEHGRSEGYP